jgi:hypothetical protein
MTKAAFVRSMPADMPAKDVVAKGAEAKIKLTDDYVYSVRSNSKKAKKKSVAGAKRTGKKTATNSGANSSASSKAKGRSPEKKKRVIELVAAHPDWTAEKISDAVGCSVNYVYAVKSEQHGPARKAAGSTSSANGAVTDFYRALKRLGVDKAKELIAGIEAYETA